MGQSELQDEIRVLRFALKVFYDIVCSTEQKAQIVEHLRHLESSSKLHFPDRSLGPALEELRELLAAKVGPHYGALPQRALNRALSAPLY